MFLGFITITIQHNNQLLILLELHDFLKILFCLHEHIILKNSLYINSKQAKDRFTVNLVLNGQSKISFKQHGDAAE